jgi:hypothetical protein
LRWRLPWFCFASSRKVGNRLFRVQFEDCHAAGAWSAARIQAGVKSSRKLTVACRCHLLFASLPVMPHKAERAERQQHPRSRFGCRLDAGKEPYFG